MAAIAALMAVWWLTEAIPIAATALLPLVLYPLLKIPPGGDIAKTYGDPLVFLFLGGFLIALAIEESDLHRRVALLIVSAVGDNPRRVVLGFMLATALLSMWISNTATTMMILPIALSVIARSDEQAGDDRFKRRFAVALLLGVAYSASIGGTATLVGTPPNLSFKVIFEEMFPAAPPVSFFGWMRLAVPFSFAMLVAAWLLLVFVLFRLGGESFLGGRLVAREQLRDLGPVKAAEWRMLAIFLTTAALWTFREPVAGWGWAPALGVDKLFDGTKLCNDGTVAIAMALLCFIVPAGGGDRRPLLAWETTRRVPWGILLLFGGGLALARGMETTGLAVFLGNALAGELSGLPVLGMVAVTVIGMMLLTELTSNLASVTMLLPVFGTTAVGLNIDPRLLMVPATLAASCAFMLPVATAPNAIVYGSGRIRMGDMIRAGCSLNAIGVGVVLLVVLLLR